MHAHAHSPAQRSSTRSLTFALVLNAVYTAIEAGVGISIGSLALLADAGHNLSDVVALAIALGAVWLAARPATPNRSFGYKRAEILAALANAITLVVIAILIFVEAARRFDDPPDVPGLWLIVTAAIGIAVNAAGAAAVFRRNAEDMNLRASFIHLAGDAIASVGVIVAGVVILLTGWRYADPVFSLVLGFLILGSSWHVLRDSVLVLLEATPRGLDAGAIGGAMAASPGVREIHDLHVWTITSGFPALSAHVLVAPGADCHAIQRALERELHERYGIDHTTLQVDHMNEERLLEIGTGRRGT